MRCDELVVQIPGRHRNMWGLQQAVECGHCVSRPQSTGAGARWTPPSSPGTGRLMQRSSIPIVLYEHYCNEERP